MARRLQPTQGKVQEPKPVGTPPKRELDLHAQIIEHCGKQWPPWKYIHANPTVKSTIQRGAPDFPIIYLPRGRFVQIECKSKDGKLDEAQVVWKAEVERLEHKVYVVRSIEEFLAAVEEVMRT